MEVICNLGDPVLNEAAGIVIRKAAESEGYGGRIVMSYRAEDGMSGDILILLYRGAMAPVCTEPMCGVLRSPYAIEELERLVRELVEGASEADEGVDVHESAAEPSEELPAEPVVIGNVVTLGGESVTLTKREAAVFSVLYANRGNPVSRESLTEQVWGGATKTNLCDVYVCRLRTALEPIFGKGFLVNIRGEGYMMV